MKINKALLKLFPVVVLTQASTISWAEPPEPELGKRWVINPLFSDEFNQNSLDSTKWYNFHPYWEGRPPALFLPSGVSVRDGNAQIRAQVLSNPRGAFTLGGGAIRSRAEGSYGYYEARIKASRIGMSTTFWLSNNKTPLLTPNHLGQNCNNDRWSNELDIIETVGNFDTLRRGRSFNTQQQFNSHIHYSSCQDADDARFSAGTLTASNLNNDLPHRKDTASDYNIYAAWWKDANNADYYLNDKLSGQVNFATNLSETPFNRTMAVNLVVETYYWAPPPSNAEANNPAINTAYYDWVRSYNLLDVDANLPDFRADNIQNGGFEKGNFHDWTSPRSTTLSITDREAFAGRYAARMDGVTELEYDLPVQKNTNYVFSGRVLIEDGILRFGAEAISFGNNVPAFGEVIVADTGNAYRNVSFVFNSDDQNSVRLYARSDRRAKILIDNVKLEALDTVTQPSYEGDVYKEEVSIKNHTVQNDAFVAQFTYKTDADARVRLVLFNGPNVVARRGIEVKAGYGHIRHDFPVADLRSLGVTGYRLDLLSATSGQLLSTTAVAAVR